MFAFPDKGPLASTSSFNCNSGDGCRIYKQAVIANSSSCKSNITIGRNTTIVGNLTVWVDAGRIKIGDSCFIGENTRIYSAKYIKIGDRVQIGHGCNIFDSNIHSLDPGERHKEYIQNITGGLVKLFGLREREVFIEDDAWLGASVIVLKGVTIGKGAIVGAGAVVTNSIPDYSVVVGNPARVVRIIEPQSTGRE